MSAPTPGNEGGSLRCQRPLDQPNQEHTGSLRRAGNGKEKPVPLLPISELLYLRQGPAATAISRDFGGGCLVDGPPPIFPADPTKQGPLQIDAQKPELVRSRDRRVTAKTSVQSGQVLHSLGLTRRGLPSDARLPRQ